MSNKSTDTIPLKDADIESMAARFWLAAGFVAVIPVLAAVLVVAI